MNEREIFQGALDHSDPAQRQAYLDEACGGDSALRARIEALLASHAATSQFLNVPAMDQLQAPAAHRQTIAFARADEVNAYEQTGLSDGDDPENSPNAAPDLSFLQPSSKPGSIGTLGSYEIVEVIGQGAFGIVFKAFDEKLQRTVAIKAMNPQLAATSPPRKRFLREARSVAAIKHENIVQVYTVEEEPLPYLVMEYIDGQTLQQKLNTTGPLDIVEILHLGRQMALGLAAAHARGLIHRDIKPGNILLEQGAEPKVKITDFGLARAADDASMTRTGVIAGTPLFMAPEQAQGLPLDHRADLFSLGSVLYQMASGRPPFRAATAIAVLKRVTEETPRPIQEIISEVPDWLCAIIGKLHAKNPEERFQSAKEVANLLGRCLAELQQHGRVESLGEVVPIVAKSTKVEIEPLQSGPSTNKKTPESAHIHLNRRWVAAAAMIGILFVGLGMTEATGVTNLRGTVIRLFSPDGVLVVELDDPSVSVTIDGEEMLITGTGAKEIRLKPGQYKVLASKDGKLVRQELVTITTNGRQVVRVSRETQPMAIVATDPVRQHVSSGQSPMDLWMRDTVALSAERQVKAVIARLQELNPGFDGKLHYLIDQGAVVEVQFPTDEVTDISALQAFQRLTILNLTSGYPGKGKLNDLTPLEGLKLKALHLNQCSQIQDLTPLRGMPLEVLEITYCSKLRDLNPLVGMPLTSLNLTYCRQLSDLSPLRGLKLKSLNLWQCANVKDLSPLAGMPLERLELWGAVKVNDLSSLAGMPLQHLDVALCSEVSDLTPLRGMPLKWLSLGDCRKLRDVVTLEGMPLETLIMGNCPLIHDLSPLRGMKLTNLYLDQSSAIRDLSPLAGMKLTKLTVDGTGVEDLTPLAGMPLELFRFTPNNINKGIDAVRQIKSLKKIGAKRSFLKEEVTDFSAEEFWKRYDTGEFNNATATAPVVDSDRRAAEYVLSIGGQIGIGFEGGPNSIGVTRLPKQSFLLTRVSLTQNDKVTDAGLAAFEGCKSLVYLGLDTTAVTDVSMVYFRECKNLEYLNLINTEIGDNGLAHFAGCKNLRILLLMNTQVGDRGLAAFKGCSKLQSLDLGAPAISDLGLENFNNCVDLEFLNLNCPRMTDTGMANFKHCKKLQSVFVKGGITDAGLEHLKTSSELKGLGVMHTRVTGAILGWLDTWPKLQGIRLTNQPVTDGHLALLKDGNPLTWLDIGDPAMTDAGMTNFLKCQNLTSLNLTATAITDNGLTPLHGLKNLRTLKLGGKNITADGLKKLAEALPGCEITWNGQTMKRKQ